MDIRPRKFNERRVAFRIEEVLPFQINHEGEVIEARTLNISTHGAMCLISKEISMMTQLDIELSLPGRSKSKSSLKKIHIKGVVVRKDKDPETNRFFIAIFFSDISDKDRLILQQFIEKSIPPKS